MVESFFATLEHELFAIGTFVTKRDAQRALFDFIRSVVQSPATAHEPRSISPVQYEAQQRAA